MKSSDPKQIVLLSVVAIGAVGFLGFTLFGAGQKVVAQLTAPADRQEGQKGALVLVTELLREPFSHPQLLRAAKEVEDERLQHQIEAPPKQSSNPDPLPGALAGGAGFSPLSLHLDQPDKASSKPAENAGANRKQIVVKGPHVGLTAIVKVDRSMAFLSVNGGETRAFREGMLVAPGLRLIAIEEGLVRLRTALKVVELRIGQEIDV